MLKSNFAFASSLVVWFIAEAGQKWTKRTPPTKKNQNWQQNQTLNKCTLQPQTFGTNCKQDRTNHDLLAAVLPRLKPLICINSLQLLIGSLCCRLGWLLQWFWCYGTLLKKKTALKWFLLNFALTEMLFTRHYLIITKPSFSLMIVSQTKTSWTRRNCRACEP